MPIYEVEVHSRIQEYYAVKASSPEEAMAKWSTGELTGEVTFGQEPVMAVLENFEEDDDAEEDEYEDDPLQHGNYDE